MNTRPSRRLAAHARAALVVVAFSIAAAVGFATAQSVGPLTRTAAESSARMHAPATAAHKHLHTAPAACPMPAGAFRVR